MSGISALTALEINNHPDDLHVSVYKGEESNKYGFIICRGPCHNYKLLISTLPFFLTIEDVAEEVKNLLTAIHSWATKELSNKDSIFAQIINPCGRVDVSHTLNHGLINRISYELRQHQVVETHRMFAVEGR